MNNISIEKAVKNILIFILFISAKNSKGQNSNNITLNATESGTQLHTACQYINLLPGYIYTATTGNYMLSNIDNSNMCDVTYISGAGFEGNNPPSLDNSRSVGTTNGSFDVNPNGAATYNISLIVPPGTMGMVPNLSINYNSQCGNSIMGQGWSLGGLSSISRSEQTIYNDGQIYPVTLANTDRFLLDGARLIIVPPATNSDYGTNNAIYHTENESYRLVTSFGSEGGGPSYFTVQNKDGSAYEYGNTYDSKVLASGNSSNPVLTWLLDKVTDNRGNYMTITYFNDNNGSYYPLSIQYTGNQNASPVITPYNQVTFSYALRGDPQTEFVAGSQTNQNVLLTGIQMYSQSTLVHHYQFDYSLDALSSHLSEITEYGSDGSSYNSTKINWHNNLVQPVTVCGLNIAQDAYSYVFWDAGLDEYVPTTAGVQPRFLITGDFSGDGLTDIVEEEQNATWPDPIFGVNWNLWQSYSTVTSTQQGVFYSGTVSGSNSTAVCGYSIWGSMSFSSEDAPYFDPEYGFSTQVPSLDINGDGKDDMVLFAQDGTYDNFQIYLGPISSSSPSHSFTGMQQGVLSLNHICPVVGDFDGDGVSDLVVFYPFGGAIFMYSYKNGVPQPAVSFYGLLDPSEATTGQAQIFFNAYAIDYNGDGRKELLVTGYYYTYLFQLNSDNTYTTLFKGNYQNFAYTQAGNPNDNAQFSATVYPGDFNGDGKTDLLIYNNYGNLDNNWLGNSWYIAYSDGTPNYQFHSAENLIAEHGPSWGTTFIPFTLTSPYEYLVADFNGDGKDDIIQLGYTSTTDVYNVDHTSDCPLCTLGQTAFSSLAMDIYFGNGNVEAGLTSSGAGAFYHHQYTENLTNSWGPVNMPIVGDFNGDGHNDLLIYNSALGASQLFSFDFNTQPDIGINKVTAIANGLNATTTIHYDNLPDLATNWGAFAFYAKGSSAVFPVEDIDMPMYIAKGTEQDNGNGGGNKTTYSYGGALLHEQGKGFLGFTKFGIYNYVMDNATLSTFDFNNGYYDQLLINSESSSYSTSSTIDSKTYIYDTIQNPTDIPNSVSYSSKIHHNFLSQETDNNELYGITNTVTYEQDLYGNNIKEIGINSAATYTTICDYSTLPYVGWNGQISVCPSNTWTTVTRLSPLQSPYYRWQYTNYNNYGQPTTKTEDIGLVTTYTYDDISANVGNPVSVSISGGISPRTYSYEYDYPYRRFVTEETNPLNQHAFASYDNAYGNQLTITDANGLVTKFSYDGFGRMQQETLPTNVKITASRLWDLTSGPGDSLFYVEVNATGEPTIKSFYDKLGKILRSQKNGFDGTYINTDMAYFDNQQPASETEPYFTANTPEYNTFTYDDFQRPYINTNAAGLSTTYSYSHGQPTYTVVTSGIYAPTKTVSQLTDASGLVIQVTDDGGSLNYIYASCGKVNSISIPGTSQFETMAYDNYGRLYTQNDPDIGLTTYTYDNLNEVLNVTDPTSNYTQTYDLLGRALTCNEAISGETNTFTYDNMTHGIGLLGSVTGTTPFTVLQNALSITTPNVVAYSYAYDIFSRPQSITENILGNNYTTSYQYDNLNRVTQITYPNTTPFSVNYSYNNYGYLSQISSSLGNIWACTGMNQYDQVTNANQGNGGTRGKTYDNLGYLQNITDAEPSGGVLAYTYSFNQKTGNLMSRSDGSNAESFTYDNLDRLTALTNISTPANNLAMSYGTGGSILTKSDAGNYSYNATQPHAVSAIANPLNIPHDVQQATNQTPALNYTPFKKISTIQEGPTTATLNTNETDYIYGPDHQRKVSMGSSNNILSKTAIYSGDYEKIMVGTNNYQLNYVSSPDGLVAMNVNNHIYYVHTDHLGSILKVYDPVTNSLVCNQSFDAWGNYRDPGSWNFVSSNTITPPDWLIRGYTGHEHMTAFGLINMNGRAYDPLVAQILSPDPVLQFPQSSQGYQKYAYCTNNPLKFTDPSGYTEDNVILFDKDGNLQGAIQQSGSDVYYQQNGNGSTYHEMGDLSNNEVDQYNMFNARLSSGDIKWENNGVAYNDLPNMNISTVSVTAEKSNKSPAIMEIDREEAAWQNNPFMRTLDYVNRNWNPVAQLELGWYASRTGRDRWTGKRVSSSEANSTMLEGGIGLALFAVPGGEGSSAFNKLAYASDYGIDNYSALRKLTNGTDLTVHHLIEQRFKTCNNLGIVLTREEHQVFTNAWRQEIGYSNSLLDLKTGTASPSDINDAAKVIYKDYPEILKALGIQ